MKKPVLYRLLLALAGLVLASYSLLRMDELFVQEQLWGSLPWWMWMGVWLFLVSGPFLWLYRSPQGPRHLALSSLTALCLHLGFMPQPFFPLSFVAFLPLLLAEHELGKEKGNSWRIWLLGFNSFLLWNILSTYWVLNSSLAAGILANVLNSLLQTIPWMLYIFVKRKHNAKVGDIAFLAFWIGFEYWHFNWELSWPWLALGHSFGHLPWLIQWYEYTGVFGGSLWVLLLNVLLYRAYREREEQAPLAQLLRPASKILLLGIALPASLSLYMYWTYQEAGPRRAEALIIQPNYEPHYEKFRIPKQEQLQRFVELVSAKIDEQIDYVLFPETSFEGIQTRELSKEPTIAFWRDFLRPYPGTKIVAGLGSYRRYDHIDELPEERRAIRSRCSEDGQHCMYLESHNSAIQISANKQEELSFYKKSKLVPGAEIMPFIGGVEFFQDLILDLGGIAGFELSTQEERSVFRSRSGKIAPLICYESVYGEYVAEFVRNGAEALFVLTNDGWWDESPGHIQHKHLSQIRAIETRRAVLRSANTGISCFINQRGEVEQASAYNEQAALRGSFRLSTEKTIYVLYGDVLARVLSFLCVLLLLSSFVKFLPGGSRKY